ncbi:uncharacterized protein LOC107849809 isoform X3 [Capsicum annuum]|uniref:uncharacterized protein LOC107849809 isoform X3 n=1 Tax=Capsicum annuum TaxID=4072 RepID=UPI001FB13863|nr:uncharacterized protein LOC107849809 isoform X3 [Capsicum annuum]
MEEDSIIIVILFGVILWTTLFVFTRNAFPKRSFDFCNRLVSTIHASLAVTLASLSVQDWSCPVCPLASKSSPKQCGSEMVAALWITEISSPFLHLRELLKELGYRDTDLNFAADVLFAIIFTIARMIGGPYLSYVTLSADNPIIIKAMALGLQLVSVFWFYKIARMVMYKLSRRSKSTTVLAKK